MPPAIKDDYYSVGGNRHSAAADWSATSSVLAFGADHNVGIWSPLNDSGRGISSLLGGHSGKVTAVKFLPFRQEIPGELLVTGSADGEISVWREDTQTQQWIRLDKATAHGGSVNTIAALNQSSIFATGGADAKLMLWRVHVEKIQPLSSFSLVPRLIPLTLALGPFASAAPIDSAFLAVGGTRNDIQVYSAEGLSSNPQLKLSAILTGHEAWIRSLALTTTTDGGFLLASASQDKYVRIWRFHLGETIPPKRLSEATDVPAPGGTLTAKIQSVSAAGYNYFITFEALLIGHEDWIYSASWSPDPSSPRLLTASADGSLSIWEPDPASGIWISISRLGEISGQKGATTATGSAGGFWTGRWGPSGKTVTSLGRTGSWRLWQFDEDSQFWTQKHAVSGHVGSVNGICWAPDGSYLLSTSSDQTTRLHAEWRRGENRSWHEFSRPQIHGYDLNCIASITPHQFTSGADEKLLRVFNEPKDIASMLHRLCQIPLPSQETHLPDSAVIPVLGLSNKAMDDSEAALEDVVMDGLGSNTTSNGMGTMLVDIQEPPTEDLLARHTLWPEHEKLYGHGSEISEAATPTDGSVLATACKASSLGQAVIRLYDTTSWNEIKPPLSAHSLTVTRLALSSNPPGYLLSVGRDRQWSVFKQAENENDAKAWTRVAMNPKAHTRMILDATWLPDTQQAAFATAGRDKVVKLWSSDQSVESDFTSRASITRKTAVTAVAATSNGTHTVLAVGEDDGNISLHLIYRQHELGVMKSIEVAKPLCPSKTVNRLAWRPVVDSDGGFQKSGQLAVASADGSVRILNISWEEMMVDQ